MSMVSVIIPAYNQGHYLGEAIQSVLEQTYENLEIIVVDDGSTDDTALVVGKFADDRLRYIHQQNQGLSAARNTGIRNAKGDLLSYLDADDLFLPEKLEALQAEMKSLPDGGLIAGQAIPIDDRGVQCAKTFDRRIPTEPAEWVFWNPLHVGSVLVDRKWQNQVGFFDRQLRSYEDWDMWIRMARVGCPMRWVPKPVSLYRFHTEQMTRDGSQMTTANFMVLEKVFSDPELPTKWKNLRDQAYSYAHLRAAAHAYLVEDFPRASDHLSQAVTLNPALLEDRARPLAMQFSAWTELPKTREPLRFLHNIYTHLPGEVSSILASRSELGDAAMRIAFQSFQAGDRQAAREAVRLAFRNKPTWIANRGALSIFLKTATPFHSIGSST